MYMRMASKIMPLPLNASPPPSSIPSRPPSTDPGGTTSKPESSYTARALPVKIYLPDNAPVIQDVIAPLSSSGELATIQPMRKLIQISGKPQTVLDVLRHFLPLLFTDKTQPYSMGTPYAQGVELPPDAEIAWLSACLCGVDGWLRIGIQLQGE